MQETTVAMAAEMPEAKYGLLLLLSARKSQEGELKNTSANIKLFVRVVNHSQPHCPI